MSTRFTTSTPFWLPAASTARILVSITALLLIVPGINAEEYDANRDPALLRCDDIYDRGNIDEAIDCFQPLTREGSVVGAG